MSEPEGSGAAWSDDGLSFEEEQAKELEAMRVKDEFARKAGYRGAPAKGDPQLAERIGRLEKLDLRGAVGKFEAFDSVVVKLTVRGAVMAVCDHEDPIVRCRYAFWGMVKSHLHAATHDSVVYPQGRSDLIVICKKIASLRKDMSDFLIHVDMDQAGLFVSETENKTEERKEVFWGAEERLSAVRDRLAEAELALSDLVANAPSTRYKNDGNLDHSVVWFLRGCASAWMMITGKMPGRTANGLFKRACVGAWTMFDWPVPEGADLNVLLEARIARGVHMKW